MSILSWIKNNINVYIPFMECFFVAFFSGIDFGNVNQIKKIIWYPHLAVGIFWYWHYRALNVHCWLFVFSFCSFKCSRKWHLVRIFRERYHNTTMWTSNNFMHKYVGSHAQLEFNVETKLLIHITQYTYTYETQKERDTHVIVVIWYFKFLPSENKNTQTFTYT